MNVYRRFYCLNTLCQAAALLGYELGLVVRINTLVRPTANTDRRTIPVGDMNI
jgi:hypothetical protein